MGKEKLRTCFVVGGGPSLSDFNFNLLRDKTTIVVNSSIFFVPNPDFFISMDYTWFLKNNVEYGVSSPYFKSKAKKYFVVGFKGDRCIKTEHGVIDRNFNLEYDLRVVDETIHASQYGGIGTTFEDFRCGRESGYSALQLAIVLGYERIYLLGMDLATVRCRTKEVSYNSHVSFSPPKQGKSTVVKLGLGGKTHFYKSTGRSDLRTMDTRFKKFLLPYPDAVKEIEEKTNCRVFSCSPISKLNKFFKYVPVEKAIRKS